MIHSNDPIFDFYYFLSPQKVPYPQKTLLKVVMVRQSNPLSDTWLARPAGLIKNVKKVDFSICSYDKLNLRGGKDMHYRRFYMAKTIIAPL